MIRRRIFENGAEPELLGSSREKYCPGEICDQFSRRMKYVSVDLPPEEWTIQAEEACAGCGKCDGNPPERSEAIVSPEVEAIYEDISDIVFWENAGIKTDWSLYPFEYMQLRALWRDCEHRVTEEREIRMQIFLRGWMKDGDTK